MNAHKLRNKFFMVCTGKETENMFMMPIDTGNKAIKTENFEFNSGITMLADVPGENEEALMYQGRYYRLSHERNVYLPDKTMDDRYYLLTLFAIAKELEEMSHSKSFIPGELISMDLVVGLPPLYYRGQYKKFREYFYRDGKIVHFVYMGKSYRVTFSNVFVHMQTYAAYTVILRPFFHVKYENKHHQKDGTYRHRKHCIQQYPSKSFTQQEILCPVSLRHHLIYSKSCKGECRNDYTTEQQEAVIFPVIFKIVPDHLIKKFGIISRKI